MPASWVEWLCSDSFRFFDYPFLILELELVFDQFIEEFGQVEPVVSALPNGVFVVFQCGLEVDVGEPVAKEAAELVLRVADFSLEPVVHLVLKVARRLGHKLSPDLLLSLVAHGVVVIHAQLILLALERPLGFFLCPAGLACSACCFTALLLCSHMSASLLLSTGC